MLIGQMSIPKISDKADYLQLDISGLSKEEVLAKYLKYNTNLPVILHGDWTKNSASENNLASRVSDYIKIINKLKEFTIIYGITIHPPTRKTMSLDEFVYYGKQIKSHTNVEVFMENRSNKRMLLSDINDIVEFSNNHFMTIDIPQLYISCGYNEDVLFNTLSKINMENVKEFHLANVLKKEKNTFVARKLDDGELDIKKILSFLNLKSYFTLEILGGVTNFQVQKNILLKLIK